MKKCCACNEVKELTKFYVNSKTIDGYFARCKRCFNEKKLCRQGRPTGISYNVKKLESKKTNGRKDSFSQIRLVNTKKVDFITTYEFLEKIGYNLSESIHEQFCAKHGLTPSEPKSFRFYFSPSDLNLL